MRSTLLTSDCITHSRWEAPSRSLAPRHRTVVYTSASSASARDSRICLITKSTFHRINPYIHPLPSVMITRLVFLLLLFCFHSASLGIFSKEVAYLILVSACAIHELSLNPWTFDITYIQNMADDCRVPHSCRLWTVLTLILSMVIRASISSM